MSGFFPNKLILSLSKEQNKSNDQEKFLKLLRTGDSQAMEMMYDQFAPALYGVAYRIVQDESIAEEILRDSFIHISQHHSDFDESKQNLCLWMINIVQRIAHKKISFAKFVEIRTPSNYVSKERIDGLSKNSTISHSERDKTYLMTRAQREVLELVFLGGGKLNEVATYLGMDENKVKQLLGDAVNHYRKETQEVAWN